MTKCEWCSSESAFHRCKRGGRLIKLCETCYRSLGILRRFEIEFLLIIKLSRIGRYSDAMSMLTSLKESLIREDVPQWFWVGLEKCEAHVLTDQGKLEDALRIYRRLVQCGIHDEFSFQFIQLCIVDILENMGKYEEAIIEIENALDAASNASPSTALDLLVKYGQLSNRINKSVPEVYRKTLLEIVSFYGLQVSAEQLHSFALADVIAVVDQAHQCAHDRYGAFLEHLGSIKSDNQAKIEYCSQYLQRETSSFYSNLARQQLRKLGNPEEKTI